MLAYVVLIIGYGIYYGKCDSFEDYFLAGRGMIWLIVGIVLFFVNIFSFIFIGLVGDVYKINIYVYNYEWFVVVVLIFFVIFFLLFYLKLGVYIMFEFLEKWYDWKLWYYFFFIIIVGNVMVDIVVGLYVGSIVLKLLFLVLFFW